MFTKVITYVFYLSINATTVDFPLPDAPTIATVFPAGICKLNLFNTVCKSRLLYKLLLVSGNYFLHAQVL